MAIKTWESSVYNNETHKWDEIPADRRDVKITHQGLVLKTWTQDVQIMSDVFDVDLMALVWDPETKAAVKRHVCCLGYAGLSTAGGRVEVDATPEVQAQYATWKAEQDRIAAEREAGEKRRTKSPGKVVRIVAGRPVGPDKKTVKKGTYGLLFWLGTQHYNGRSATRVGVAITNRKNDQGLFADVVWTYSQNIEVVGVESDEAMAAAIEAFETGAQIPAQAA
jgi:hypothetical protein